MPRTDVKGYIRVFKESYAHMRKQEAAQAVAVAPVEPDVLLERHLANVARQVGEQVTQDGGSTEDARVAEEKARAVLGLGSPGTESSSSTSSASSPQSSRSGTSGRSLRGLANSKLADYLPALLWITRARSLHLLGLSNASGDKDGTSTP